MAGKRVLCTGGTGYIGSHTVIHLVEAGYEVAILDNFVNSHPAVAQRLNEITGKKIPMYNIDMRNKEALRELFKKEKFDGVIHYAALKNVGESVAKPVAYYDNNINSMLNLLEAMTEAGCKSLVFSSSATVYKESTEILTEEHPIGAINPYGQTKVIGEQIMRDLFRADPSWKLYSLRYFNPVGAHPSGRIGEDPAVPMNILPIIQRVAIGAIPEVSVCGNDWPTPDGTGVRDYIHVEDLAEGHVMALKDLFSSTEGKLEFVNLGTGRGTSVLELIKMFEEESGKPVPYKLVARRAGDVPSVAADCQRAKEKIGWTAKRTIREACASSWKWQSQNPKGFSGQTEKSTSQS